MLLVRIRGIDGDRTLAKPCDQLHQMLLLRLGAALVLLDQALREQAPDALAHQKVGDQIALEQTHRQRRGHGFGGGVHKSYLGAGEF